MPKGQAFRNKSGKETVLSFFVNSIASDDTEGEPEQRDTSELDFQERELAHCKNSPEHFIQNYCYIFDTSKGKDFGVTGKGSGGDWIPFKLWKEQIEILEMFVDNQKIIVLKARQNGLTWLALAFALWQCLFQPIAMILVYSLRDDEAMAMLGDKKLEGMYKHLPNWMKLDLVSKSNHKWKFSNGSEIVALPTTAGDSYTATMAVIDEADLIPDLNDLLQRVKPTIDAGGKLMLISRSNKKKPKSMFKKIYRAAKDKKNDFICAFLPWFVRPGRTQAWYEKEKASVLADTGALDNLYESYPNNDKEALAPSTLDKRVPFDLLEAHSAEVDQIDMTNLMNLPFILPFIPGLRIYELPIPGDKYTIGADPAEGNPSSDDSGGSVLHHKTGKQVACFNGKHEPEIFAQYLANLSDIFNNAGILVERNNHGHAVILALKILKRKLYLGADEKIGYQSNKKTKVELYDHFVKSLLTDDMLILDFETFNQIASVEGNTLLAPEGEFEDLSDATCLADIARTLKLERTEGKSALSFGRTKGWTPLQRRNR